MLVFRAIGQDIVLVIREDSKTVFLRLPVQIRNHGRIDSFLEHQFSGLGIDDLTSVIR